MTRDERLEELNEIVKSEEEVIEREINALLSPHISNKIKINISRYNWKKELIGNIYVVDDENKEVFGTSIQFKISERTIGLEIDYSSIGSHNSTERKSAYKDKDILIGKIWEYECEIIQIYNNIKWDNLCELEQIYKEQYNEDVAKRTAEFEENQRKERIELDKILDHIHDNIVIKSSDYYNSEIHIKKVGRKNITLFYSIKIGGQRKSVIDKYELAKYILNRNYIYFR